MRRKSVPTSAWYRKKIDGAGGSEPSTVGSTETARLLGSEPGVQVSFTEALVRFIDRHKKEAGVGMFGPKLGTWYVESKQDPRWNKTGRGMGLVSTGGPDDLHEWIESCRKKYGAPPDDCTQGFMKD